MNKYHKVNNLENLFTKTVYISRNRKRNVTLDYREKNVKRKNELIRKKKSSLTGD